MPDHHERDAGLDRGGERREVDGIERSARAPDGDDRVVGVRRRAADAGEVLRGRGDSAGSPAAHCGAHGVARRSRVAREGATGESGSRNARHVGDRRERDGDSSGAQLSCGCSRIRAHRSSAELPRLSCKRPRPGKPPNRAALLIDCNDRASTLAAQRTGQLAQLARPDDVAAEQDHAGDAALAQRLAYVLGRCRAGEAQYEQLPNLLLECQLVDRAAGFLALLESQKAECEKEPDDAGDHRTYVVNSTTLPSGSAR